MLLMVCQLETLEKTRYVRKHESYSMTYFCELLTINPLDAKPFSLMSAKGFFVKFVYREVMMLSV
jgi:hypothetical protein